MVSSTAFMCNAVPSPGRVICSLVPGIPTIPTIPTTICNIYLTLQESSLQRRAQEPEGHKQPASEPNDDSRPKPRPGTFTSCSRFCAVLEAHALLYCVAICHPSFHKGHHRPCQENMRSLLRT